MYTVCLLLWKYAVFSLLLRCPEKPVSVIVAPLGHVRKTGRPAAFPARPEHLCGQGSEGHGAGEPSSVLDSTSARQLPYPTPSPPITSPSAALLTALRLPRSLQTWLATISARGYARGTIGIIMTIIMANIYGTFFVPDALCRQLILCPQQLYNFLHFRDKPQLRESV